MEISDNSTTSATDDKADSALGDVAPVVATLGQSPGGSALIVGDASAFPSQGWAAVDSQLVTWTGKTSTSLTGLPGSGPGALVSAVKAGASIVSKPMLTGVSGVLYPILAGDAVNIHVRCDDVAAQTALAAEQGGGSDGVIEHGIQDGRLGVAGATATGNADLAIFSRPILTVRYAALDPNTRSGKTIHVDLPDLNVVGDFTIQSVTIDQIGVAVGVWPRYTAEASSVRFSLEDVLRRLRLTL